MKVVQCIAVVQWLKDSALLPKLFTYTSRARNSFVVILRFPSMLIRLKAVVKAAKSFASCSLPLSTGGSIAACASFVGDFGWQGAGGCVTTAEEELLKHSDFGSFVAGCFKGNPFAVGTVSLEDVRDKMAIVLAERELDVLEFCG